ncbi:MAG: hypothetical protein QME07_01015 [bacterium]|nr:hypothetical protein [bacterium]
MSKLTVRLPEGLHHRLRQKARVTSLTLNQMIINSLQAGLAQESAKLSEKEKAISALQETGLIRKLGEGYNDLVKKGEKVNRDTLYKSLSSKIKGKSLSEIIIEDRGRL